MTHIQFYTIYLDIKLLKSEESKKMEKRMTDPLNKRMNEQQKNDTMQRKRSVYGLNNCSGTVLQISSEKNH